MTRKKLDALKLKIRTLKEMAADLKNITGHAGAIVNLLPEEIRSVIEKYI